MGVWIETNLIAANLKEESVTPHVGVWIETSDALLASHRPFVTPHVGVWIETSVKNSQKFQISCHSPRGSVD